MILHLLKRTKLEHGKGGFTTRNREKNMEGQKERSTCLLAKQSQMSGVNVQSCKMNSCAIQSSFNIKGNPETVNCSFQISQIFQIWDFPHIFGT